MTLCMWTPYFPPFPQRSQRLLRLLPHRQMKTGFPKALRHEISKVPSAHKPHLRLYCRKASLKCNFSARTRLRRHSFL